VVGPLENRRGQGHEPPEQIEGFGRIRLGDRLDDCSKPADNSCAVQHSPTRKICICAAQQHVVGGVWEAADATVAKASRATVETVQRAGGDGVSGAEIAKALDLDKSSASRRVKVAISKGYLVNRETGTGKRARIALGDPMPDDAEILPH